MSRGRHEGGYRELEPLSAEAKLDELAGLADLVKPFSLSKFNSQVAQNTVQAVVTSRIGKGKQGLLVAFSFDNSSGNYSLSPWAIRLTSVNPETNAAMNPGQGDLLLGPFETPVGSLTQPFVLPYPASIPDDKQVCIVTTQKSAAPADLQGMLYGVFWDKEQNRDVRRALYGKRGADLWPLALFGGGK